MLITENTVRKVRLERTIIVRVRKTRKYINNSLISSMGPNTIKAIWAERFLPGNPNTFFYKGLSLEGMGRIEASANQYYRYLQSVKEGTLAKHAYQRLIQWGYIR